MGDRYEWPLTARRERLLDNAERITGENTRSKAIEQALQHLVETEQAFQKWDDLQLTPEQAKGVSTSVIRLSYYPQVK